MENLNTVDETQLLEDTLNQLELDSVLVFICKFCFSELGKELILKSRPTENLFWLRKEHTMIEEAALMLSSDTQLPIEGISDVKPKLHKSLVANAVLSTNEIMSVFDFIRVSRLVKGYFSTRTEKYPEIYDESSLLFENKILEKHITDSIDETGNVRDTASKELLRIRHELNEKSARLRNRLQKILHRVAEEDMVMDELVTLREGRFVLPVKVEHKRHIPGIIHGVSQTGATVFLEPSEIFEMNNELSLLLSEEKREIYKILSNLTSEIGDEARVILSSVDIIAHLDSVIAKARYALEFGGIKPEILDEDEIYISNIRHPILVQSKGVKKVIPLNIDFTSKVRGHLISGPNAGGKTVALKSIGLNVAMALSGIFPLGELKTNYRTIFASIGDRQSIENDLSTFSSQIFQIRNILDNCTSKSLVLIDEICSGTDPQEGSALAAGVLESFIELNLFFIVTTHQSSLKSFALSRNEISNASLEFDDTKLKPTYKFLQGTPGNSYAFILAESLGLSKLVLDRAKKYLGSRQTELEESIRVLQKYKSEAETLKIQASQERLKFESLRKDYEEKYKEIKAKRKELIQIAQQEAYQILNNANALVENTIRQIKEEKRSVSEIKTDYNKAKQELEQVIKEVVKESKANTSEFFVGDFVTHTESSGSIGNVLDINYNNQTALVEFGGVKFRLPINQLEKTDLTPKIQSDKSSYIRFDVKTRVDLRGMRAFEAIKEIEDLINQGLSGNVDMLTIIHGKGTGALRQAIHDFLSNHPSVQSFRLGNLVEGGSGVTIVEL